MLTRWRSKLHTAAGAIALGGFLILWLAIWPFWLVCAHYLTPTERSSLSHG